MFKKLWNKYFGGKEKENNVFKLAVGIAIVAVALFPMPIYFILKSSYFSAQIEDYFSFWYFYLFYIILYFVALGTIGFENKLLDNEFVFLVMGFLIQLAIVYGLDFIFTSVNLTNTILRPQAPVFRHGDRSFLTL